jgi:[acyl-carrier-protein] S-malonyltransferase
MMAFVFPGQGSQYIGMCKELYGEFPTVRKTFEEASDVLHLDMAKLCFDEGSNDLNLTVNAQPAILTASIAALRVLNEEAGFQADYVAGHSLGEYSALVASETLEFKDAVWIVRERGKFTQEAVPVGVGAMAAVLGLETDVVEGICEEASTNGFVVSPANFNAPGQTVISGNREAVEKATSLSKERGAKRVVLLEVSAPFHCKLMAPAAERLAQVLDKINFSEFKIPIVTNLDAKINIDPARIRDLLIDQVMSPVRWYESIKTLYEAGVRRFLEVGPGNVLSGLIKRTVPDAFVRNFEKVGHLKQLKQDGI